MREFLITFRYIDTGNKKTETMTVSDTDIDSALPIEEIIKNRWAGLLCSSGGLREIISIAEK